MRVAGTTIAIVLALAFQTTVAYGLLGNRPVVDLVLVLVVYVALGSGPVVGLLLGSMAGLLQDALSGGIIGTGGLAKSVVGFLAGVLGQQFIIVNAVPRFVVFFLGTLVHAGLFLGLYQLIEPRAVERPWAAAVTQAAVNGCVGILAFHFVERTPDWLHRRRMRRSVIRR